MHPDEKQHPKFELIASKELVLFPAENQLGSGEHYALSKNDSFYAYVIGRTDGD